MVQIATFLVLALSAATTLASPHGRTGTSSHHHRAVAVQARGARACRDKVVPPPVNQLDKSASVKSSTKSSTKSSIKSSTKTASSSSSSSKPTKGSTKGSTKDDGSSVDTGAGIDTPPASHSSAHSAALFPLSLSAAAESFSTSSSAAAGKAMALSDATLHPQSGASNKGHSYAKAPDGVMSIRAVFDKGSISPGHGNGNLVGGMSMYALGPIDLSTGNTIIFSYSVLFPKGFAFNKGGKLPGLYGGTDDKVATTCSGGRHNINCWSTRMMWRAGGAGELYAYLPQSAQNNKAYESVPPHTKANDDYGASVGRGSFDWTAGTRQVMAQRVTLNTPGKFDGQVEIYVNGESKFILHGVSFRNSAKSKCRGMQMQTFFGGHDKSWASPKTQQVYFSDISAAVYH